MDGYSSVRRNLNYTKRLVELLAEYADKNDESILDVGSRGVDLISHLHFRRKVSIDLVDPLVMEGVVGLKQDFFDYNPYEMFDIVGCFQTLEHIVRVQDFTDKLFALSRKYVFISVPYKWRRGLCKYHVHDPVDDVKLALWTNRTPIFHELVTDGKYERLICVYKK